MSKFLDQARLAIMGVIVSAVLMMISDNTLAFVGVLILVLSLFMLFQTPYWNHNLTHASKLLSGQLVMSLVGGVFLVWLKDMSHSQLLFSVLSLGISLVSCAMMYTLFLGADNQAVVQVKSFATLLMLLILVSRIMFTVSGGIVADLSTSYLTVVFNGLIVYVYVKLLNSINR
ncbi:hypothetical protein G7062_05515 [Erysipelothrix sp. HDW6C]|uniref:hypothetical protein n=1 Tax=Erysipelothrix sp. HDW6C TaxID=2714930 RepID=UPI00140A4C00|nr:hypothetical protein [Erysipelothrix sp. HDW6C]QIK69782.1 hypothetical protein G7062_05515 [Erysipelothrix sp. HDW6C]